MPLCLEIILVGQETDSAKGRTNRQIPLANLCGATVRQL